MEVAGIVIKLKLQAGAATLKSILERMVDQTINMSKTENNPSHKKGDETALAQK